MFTALDSSSSVAWYSSVCVKSPCEIVLGTTDSAALHCSVCVAVVSRSVHSGSSKRGSEMLGVGFVNRTFIDINSGNLNSGPMAIKTID